jgi:hypothetical protein
MPEHISRSGGGQGWGRVGVDDRAPIRFRDDRIATLQDDDGTTPCCGATRAREFIAARIEQPFELTLVPLHDTRPLDRLHRPILISAIEFDLRTGCFHGSERFCWRRVAASHIEWQLDSR